MAERRPDVALYKDALASAVFAWWSAEGAIEVATLPSPTTYPRPPLVFPNTGYTPGDDDSFVELDWLPASSTPTGNATRPIKMQPATMQITIYVRSGSGEALLDKIADRVALMWREIDVNTLHTFSTDDPAPAPAPPPGYYGQVIRTEALRITQPATS